MNKNAKFEFLVGIDDVKEIIEGEFEFIFDGIAIETFEKYKSAEILQIATELTSYSFHIFLSEKFYRLYRRISGNKRISRWLILTLTDSPSELNVTQFIENNANPQPQIRYFEKISLLSEDNSTSKELNNLFSWQTLSKANYNEIGLQLNSAIKESNYIKYNIYDVGQGNLSAITDENNLPLIYFDLGGGWRFNRRTYPKRVDLCFTMPQTVVISHWDWDHLETARRYMYDDWSKFDGFSWIVPEQDITVSYFKILAKMYENGKVFIWPRTGIPKVIFNGGIIIKCLGKEKNHSGLALLVQSKKNCIGLPI